MLVVERMKNLRKKNNLTQEDLAAKVNISPMTAMRWEQNNTEPRAQELQKLAKALNTTSASLLGDTDDLHPAANKGETQAKAQAQTEPEQLLIEDKGACYKDVSASRVVLRYKFSSDREIELPDTPDNLAFFQGIVREDLKQFAVSAG